MSYGRQQETRRRRSTGGAWKVRLMIAGAIVLFSVLTFVTNTDVNPVTGEKQRVGGMTEEQEIALGLQARPQMVQQHGGMDRSVQDQRVVDEVGIRLLNSLQAVLNQNRRKIPYTFEFHLLADSRTINAFALPGGQVFVTRALYDNFQTRDQLAGVLGHEIGHVIERHGAQRMAKGRMWQGLIGAAGVAGGDQNSAQMASMIGNLINMKYGRDDEYQSDKWGVLLTSLAGYDPAAMLEVMDILESAAGGRNVPEMMSTHPQPKNRKDKIKSLIKDMENTRVSSAVPGNPQPIERRSPGENQSPPRWDAQ